MDNAPSPSFATWRTDMIANHVSSLKVLIHCDMENAPSPYFATWSKVTTDRVITTHVNILQTNW